MKKPDPYNEKAFDALFAGKANINYDFDIRTMGVKDRKIVKLLFEYGVKGKKCLDIGPGTGRWLQFMQKNGADFLGAIDISQKALERSAQICGRIQKGDLETDAFDFKSDSFDIVLSIEVLEHLRDPDNYLSEIRRVLKTGGIAVFSTPNVVSFVSRMRVLLGRLPVAISTDKTHVKFYGRRDIKQLFKHYNMTPEFIPTSFSLNPLNAKSKFRIPTSPRTSSMDDCILFTVRIGK